MRLFWVSATNSLPPDNQTPCGPRMPPADVAGALDVKSCCPSTTAGSVPFTDGIVCQSRTRLLFVSATATRTPSL